LNGADVEFVDPSANDGKYGIVAVHLTTPSDIVSVDKGKRVESHVSSKWIGNQEKVT